MEYEEEENLTGESFVNRIKEVFLNKDKYITSQKNADIADSVKKTVELIKSTAERK